MATVAGEPELLAHHFTQTGLTESAIEWWVKAAHRSLARSAMLEAEALLRKGLNLLSNLNDDTRRREYELDLQVGLGLALSQTQGFHAEATGDAYFPRANSAINSNAHTNFCLSSTVRSEAIAEARLTLHAPTLARILGYACRTGWCAHTNPSTLLRYAEELVSVSAERELVFWQKVGTVYCGWCLASLGDGEQGVRSLRMGYLISTTLLMPLWFSRCWPTPFEQSAI